MSKSQACLIAALASLALAGCKSPRPRARPRPRPRATPQASPKPTPVELPTIRSGRPAGNPRPAATRSDHFSETVLDFRAGDLVDIVLTNGGRARGRVRTASDQELTLSAEGTSIITRLEPPEVASARLVYRAPVRRPESVVGDEPKSERETWLERFADREVFNGEASRLWRGRFRRNTALTVSRPFELETATWAATTARTTFFSRGGSWSFQRGDEIKILGISHGTEQVGASDVCLGEVYLLLRRRDGEVRKVYTAQPLSPSNFERDGLVELLDGEPTTFVITYPGSEEEIVKILRVEARISRSYLRRIERLPDRAAMRRMRARRSPQLAQAEADVRAIYGRFGLDKPQDVGRSIKIRTRVPMIVGTLRLIDFEREIGLD